MVANTNQIGVNGGIMNTNKAIDVANWFIDRANKEKLEDKVSEGITNLKLQKILYFAQAAHLAIYENKPLFDDEIIAWQYGPVIEGVYHQFKPTKRSSSTRTNLPIEKPTSDDYLKLSGETMAFLENTWNIFGKFSASKLVDMSHAHRPWKTAYAVGDSTVITHQSMYEYYRDVFRLA